MTVRVKGCLFDGEIHTRETNSRHFFLSMRGARTIDDDIGMMEHTSITGPDFNSAHPALRLNRNRHDEIPEDFPAPAR